MVSWAAVLGSGVCTEQAPPKLRPPLLCFVLSSRFFVTPWRHRRGCFESSLFGSIVFLNLAASIFSLCGRFLQLESLSLVVMKNDLRHKHEPPPPLSIFKRYVTGYVLFCDTLVLCFRYIILSLYTVPVCFFNYALPGKQGVPLFAATIKGRASRGGGGLRYVNRGYSKEEEGVACGIRLSLSIFLPMMCSG